MLQGFDLEWCKQPDIGLPRPDAVLYLTLSSEAAGKRGGFGQERYETTEFQSKVDKNFQQIQDNSWKVCYSFWLYEGCYVNTRTIAVAKTLMAVE